jgi:hypothetical protein
MAFRRLRALFAVSLTFGVLQLLSLAATRLGEARADAAQVWMPLQQKLQTNVHGARSGLVESDAHHVPATPFEASASVAPAVAARGIAPPSSSAPAFGAAAPSDRPLARAPPSAS